MKYAVLLEQIRSGILDKAPWYLGLVKGFNICLNPVVNNFTNKQYLSYS